jgi:hypothetical protein
MEAFDYLILRKLSDWYVYGRDWREHPLGTDQDLPQALARYGAEGWEVVGTCSDEEFFSSIILKRRVPAPAPNGSAAGAVRKPSARRPAAAAAGA